MKIPRSVRKCPRCHGSGWEQVWRGADLRKARERAGITLREVARRIGLSATYISDVERDNRTATERIVNAYKEL